MCRKKSICGHVCAANLWLAEILVPVKSDEFIISQRRRHHSSAMNLPRGGKVASGPSAAFFIFSYLKGCVWSTRVKWMVPFIAIPPFSFGATLLPLIMQPSVFIIAKSESQKNPTRHTTAFIFSIIHTPCKTDANFITHPSGKEMCG
jgi:hypothetical protein